MSEQVPRRGSGLQAFLMIAALAASCAVGGYYWYTASHGATRLAETGFDVARVEAPAPVSSYAAPAAPKSSPMPIAGMPGLQTAGAAAGAEQQAGQFQRGAPSQGGAAAAPGPSDADRAREKEFLAKHGAELKAYEGRVLNPIAQRWFRKNATVRRVDAEFAKLPRYMALKRQVDKDHDPYAFARGAIALPEVRKEIAKCLADPEVWKAAFGMINEALKNPPPKDIYDEAKHFMTHETGVTDYMANEFVPAAQKNQSAIMGALGPDTDISGLQKLAQDIGPPGAIPAMPAGMSPAALGALTGGQPPKR
jgi:hypothetical protein